MKASVMEKGNEIICAKKHANQQVSLVLLDNKLKPNQRLLCQQCMEEVDDPHFSLMSFKKVAEKIQLEQDKLYENFYQQAKKTIEQIDLFKQTINLLKSNIVTKLDEVLGFSDILINTLMEKITQRSSYSLITSLEDFESPIEQKMQEQMKVIYQCNYSYYKKIEVAFLNNPYLQDLNQCQKILQEVFDDNQVLNQQLLFSRIRIEEYGYKNTLEMEQQCTKHQSKLMLIDISIGVQKEDRIKCLYCDKGNTIPVIEFVQKWKAYDSVRKDRIKKLIMQKITKLKMVKEMLNQFVLTQYQQSNELINIIVNHLLFGDRELIDQRLNGNVPLKDLIVNLAEEISYFKEENLTKEEFFEFKSHSIFQQGVLKQFKKMNRCRQNMIESILVKLTEK